MNVEQILTEELRSVAASVEAPLPPIAGLVRDAEHARTRTLRTRLAGTVLVAAAVVGAIVIGTQVGRPSTAPPPTNPSPSPSYYASGVPYVLGGVLYIDHEPQPGQWSHAVTVGEYTTAFPRDDDPLTDTAVILRNGVEVDTVSDVFHGPEFSPGATKMAWFTATRYTGELVVRDLADFRDLGQLPVELGSPGGAQPQLRVEDDGTVFYNTHYPTDDLNWSWKPGGAQVKVATSPREDGIPNPAGFQGIRATVRLSPDHLWGAWLTDRDGGTLAADEDPGGLTVQKPGEPDSRFTIPVAGVTGPGSMALWDSPTRLTILGDSEVSCDVAERWCRDATEPEEP